MTPVETLPDEATAQRSLGPPWGDCGASGQYARDSGNNHNEEGIQATQNGTVPSSGE